MTAYVSRSGWGALPPNRQSADRETTTHVIVHHFGTPKPRDVAEARQQMQAVQRDHLSRPIYVNGKPLLDANGNIVYWADFAYNETGAAGVIFEGRGVDVKSGGTGVGNKKPPPPGFSTWDECSVSLAVMGNFQTEPVDELTRQAVVDAFRRYRQRYGDDLIVLGDRDVNTTACCGDNLYSILPELWAESGDDMPSVEEIWNHPLTKTLPDGSSQTFPAWQWLIFTHMEAANDGGAGGGASAGEVADEFARRLQA